MAQRSTLNGMREKPRYEISADEPVQPTLDGYRAQIIFDELMPKIDQKMEGNLKTGIMYGSNVSGLSAFSDSELYDFDSDIDLFIVTDVEPNVARRSVEDSIAELNAVPEINVDICEASYFEGKLGVAKDADNPEELIDEELEITYNDYHYFERSLPRRLRAFGNGYIPHSDYKDHVDIIEASLDNIFEIMQNSEKLEEEYWRGSRDPSARVDKMLE